MRSIVKAGCLVGIAFLAFAASPASTTSSRVAAGDLHRLKLKSFTVPTSPGPVGLLIGVRVNDGPSLELLLDSGAQFLVIDRKTAARSGCAGGVAIDLVGAGGRSPRAAKISNARSVEVGGLVLRDIDIAIVEGRLIDGVDGVLPLSLFADYLIRLDVPAKNLELSPYPTEATPGPPGEYSRAISANGLLFVKGLLNNSHEGLFLLDTGASYNAISTTLARRMHSSTALAPVLPVESGVARMDATLVREVRRLRVGASELHTDPLVAVDLSTASRYYNFEVSGMLGYPALRSSVVTVNYRQGLVQIERK